ncbi:MAG: hypothetical protein U0736_12290 [Gemmataceae bacterium]
MVKKMSAHAGGKVRPATAPARAGKVDTAEEQILRQATLYLIQKHGMFLVATRARPLRIRGMAVWVITVTLRLTAGQEGTIGDLLYDGEAFTFLTDPAVMEERACQIAGDTAGR